MAENFLTGMGGSRAGATAGLENNTRSLVFTSASDSRASENFDISSENYFFPMYANIFWDAGQVPILRYFEAWTGGTAPPPERSQKRFSWQYWSGSPGKSQRY